MGARKTLRVVDPEEAAHAPEPEPDLTLAEAVETGDYRTILVAQRREIARSIPDERGPAKAALHRQLSAIGKELEAIDRRSRQEAGEDGDGHEAPDEEWDTASI